MPSEQPADARLDADVEAWIRAARAGSQDALGSLWQVFQQYLGLIAHYGISSELRAKVGSSDLLQDTFLEAQRDFTSFRGETQAQLQAWLRRLLLNNLLNVRRSFRGTQMRELGREQSLPGALQSDGWHPAGDDTSPSERVIRQEEAARLERALETLPEHYRQVIELRNHQRLSFVEIGSRMNRSEDGARMLWARAFERLAKALDD